MSRLIAHCSIIQLQTGAQTSASIINPEEADEVSSVGGSVILECHTTADLVVAWFWLKQIPGQKLNPIVSTYYQEIKLQEEFLNESRLQFKVDDKKSALIFTEINARDAAYYHCGVLLYEKLYFGGGTYLTPVKIIQHPVLDLHHVGDSVNLHCTIFGESCSGGQSVYWLRYKPRESHSGIIYTDGDRKDQCETISVTGSTVQSCVHKVPKSLASDEIYFCSVVTCGKLIVGNGTKLIKTLAYIITLLSAVLVISVIVNVIVVLLWRRATHREYFHINMTQNIISTTTCVLGAIVLLHDPLSLETQFSDRGPDIFL
uniref:Ig-like domain-containing protein n=1 Tax=Cyprinus carpio TaxID=7962 RepID=A0A8C2Q2C8_CYPCA